MANDLDLPFCRWVFHNVFVCKSDDFCHCGTVHNRHNCLSSGNRCIRRNACASFWSDWKWNMQKTKMFDISDGPHCWIHASITISYLFIVMIIIISIADHRTLEAGRAGHSRHLSGITIANIHGAAFALGARFQRAGTHFPAILFTRLRRRRTHRHRRCCLLNLNIRIISILMMHRCHIRIMMQSIFQLIIGRLILDHGNGVALWRWWRIRRHRLIQLNVTFVNILLLNAGYVTRLYRRRHQRIWPRIHRCQCVKARCGQRCQTILQRMDRCQLGKWSVAGCAVRIWRYWHRHWCQMRQRRFGHHIRLGIWMKLALEWGELREGLEALILGIHFPRTCIIIALLRCDYIGTGSIPIVIVPRWIQFGAECGKRWQTAISTVFGRLYTHHTFEKYALWTRTRKTKIYRKSFVCLFCPVCLANCSNCSHWHAHFT